MFVKKRGYYVYKAFRLRETYFMKQKQGKQRLLIHLQNATTIFRCMPST